MKIKHKQHSLELLYISIYIVYQYVQSNSMHKSTQLYVQTAANMYMHLKAYRLNLISLYFLYM